MNYNCIGTIDVSDLKYKIEQLPQDSWREDLTRQKIHQVHQSTETIFLMWDLDSMNKLMVGKKTKYYDYFDMDSFSERLLPIFEKSYGKGRMLKYIFANLKSGGMIPPHVDNAPIVPFIKKIHIPIFTNDDVIFRVNGEQKNMKEGEIWEMNIQKTHSVYNNSNQDRIHLIATYQPI